MKKNKKVDKCVSKNNVGSSVYNFIRQFDEFMLCSAHSMFAFIHFIKNSISNNLRSLEKYFIFIIINRPLDSNLSIKFEEKHRP